MSKRLFVTGTGTEVGKTYITALLLKKLHESGFRCAYFKAAMSGNDRAPDGGLIPGDARHVREVSGISQPLETMCPFVYETAVSPHLAARLEGNPLDLEAVKAGFDRLAAQYDYIIAEGSGGIVCPLRYDEKKIFRQIFRLQKFVLHHHCVLAWHHTLFHKRHERQVCASVCPDRQCAFHIFLQSASLSEPCIPQPVVHR